MDRPKMGPGVILLITSLIYHGHCFTSMDVNPKAVIQPVRTSVMVDCTAIGTPQPTITWYLDGLPVQDSSERQVLSNGTLYISLLRRKFAGLYKCEAKTDKLQLYSSVRIEVATLSKMTQIPNLIDIVNNKVNITCFKPKGNPAPSVRWLLGDGSPLPNDARFQPSGWSLVIDPLKFGDTGNYTCVAENIARDRTSTMQLTATIPGSNVVTPKVRTVVEGQPTSMTCTSTARPPLAVMWKRCHADPGCSTLIPVTALPHTDNYVVYPNGTLLIKKARMDDNGTYHCISEIKTSFYEEKGELFVRELVKLENFVKRKQIFNYDNRNTPQNVTCRFRGYGKITVQWSKKGTTSLPSHMYSNKEDQLTIEKINFSDEGTYVCTARGPNNTVSGEITVLVYVFPKFTLRPQNASVVVDDPVWIHCKGSGQPKPKVSWIRENTGMRVTVNGTHSRTLANGTLYIPKSKIEDTGEYTCILSNGPTIELASSFIKVSDGAIIPGKGKSQPQMGRTIGIAVGCAGAYIVIVVGLMIYCRSRRSRMLREQNVNCGPIDDGEEHKNPLLNEECLPMDPAAYQFPREDLEELETVGRGKIGRVYTAKASGIADGAMKTLVAVKELTIKNSVLREDFESEYGMLANLRHDCVVKLLGICTDNYPLLMITEYSEKGDLKQFLQSTQENCNGVNGSGPPHHQLTDANRVNICHHIAAGMEYLSSNRLIHRDLAARNCVIFPNMDVKIAFLSLCEDRYEEDYYQLNGISVPLRWLSPEVINDEQYSEKSDVWAYGVVMWEVYSSGLRPYSDCTNDAIVKFLESDLRLPKPSGCNSEMWKIMQSCWAPNPDNRPGFSGVMAALNEMPMDSHV